MESWDFIHGSPNDQRKRFCVGYMFSPDLSKVVMVRKNRPGWQAGKLNGPGGKLNPGESAYNAMVREFREETGVESSSAGWKPICRLEFSEAVVWFFYCISSTYSLSSTQTDEKIEITDIAQLMATFDSIIPNTCWIIQMALSKMRGERASYFRVLEEYP